MNKSMMVGAIFLDFSKAFDLVNHNLLLQKLSAYRVSRPSIALFTSYLSDRCQYVFLNGRQSSIGKIKAGVPQGSILGPLLFSVYINDLPLHISDKNVRCTLFADDSTLDVSSRHVLTINNSLQQSLLDVSDWCQHNSMVLNPSKTECMLLATRQKQQLHPPPLSLSLNFQPLKQVSNHRLLGVTIDDQLSWHTHVENICKTISKNLYLLSKLTYFTDSPTRKLFYNAHIQSHIDYASTIWDGCSDACIKRLNSLHRRAAKLILYKSTDSTDDRLIALGMLPLRKHLLFNKGVVMHKVHKSQVPKYLSGLFSATSSPYSISRNNLSVPRPRIDIFKNSISYSGAHFWNSLPAQVKNSSSASSFKARLFTYLRDL